MIFREYRRDNPEKQATLDTQDEEKQNKTTTQYALDTITRKQTQTTQPRHAPSHKQLETKMNRTCFYAEIVTDITTRNSVK